MWWWSCLHLPPHSTSACVLLLHWLEHIASMHIYTNTKEALQNTLKPTHRSREGAMHLA